jgi:hypothetical protein
MKHFYYVYLLPSEMKRQTHSARKLKVTVQNAIRLRYLRFLRDHDHALPDKR